MFCANDPDVCIPFSVFIKLMPFGTGERGKRTITMNFAFVHEVYVTLWCDVCAWDWEYCCSSCVWMCVLWMNWTYSSQPDGVCVCVWVWMGSSSIQMSDVLCAHQMIIIHCDSNATHNTLRTNTFSWKTKRVESFIVSILPNKHTIPHPLDRSASFFFTAKTSFSLLKISKLKRIAYATAHVFVCGGIHVLFAFLKTDRELLHWRETRESKLWQDKVFHNHCVKYLDEELVASVEFSSESNKRATSLLSERNEQRTRPWMPWIVIFYLNFISCRHQPANHVATHTTYGERWNNTQHFDEKWHAIHCVVVVNRLAWQRSQEFRTKKKCEKCCGKGSTTIRFDESVCVCAM